MGRDHGSKHKHRHGAPEAHLTAHQEAIHRATLDYLLHPVVDPDRPEQRIPWCELEQRQRARGYRLASSSPATTTRAQVN